MSDIGEQTFIPKSSDVILRWVTGDRTNVPRLVAMTFNMFSSSFSRSQILALASVACLHSSEQVNNSWMSKKETKDTLVKSDRNVHLEYSQDIGSRSWGPGAGEIYERNLMAPSYVDSSSTSTEIQIYTSE